MNHHSPSTGPVTLRSVAPILGPGCLLGLWTSLRSHRSKEQMRTAVLDASTQAVAVLVLTLSRYLPKQGGASSLALAVLVAYPVTLLGALCVGVILALSLRPRADRTWLVFLLALLAQGMEWMHWNSLPLDFAPETLTFHGDAGLMEQVLVNRAVNARDAVPEGGTLRIMARSETRPPPATPELPNPPSSAHVRLSVADTGTGIPLEIREKIFEPFFTTKEAGKGTGLGLATVFGIVQQHHGWIEVESEVGHGTFFTFSCRSELVLLVEDEPSVQEWGRQALLRQGYRVMTADNGRAALQFWARHKEEIDLLLTDMIMPDGITGRQLAQQLLQDKPGLRVVSSSGYSADIAGKELKLTDGVNYLAKPY